MSLNRSHLREVTIAQDIRDPASHRRKVFSTRVRHVLKKPSAIFFLADKQSNSVFFTLQTGSRSFNTFGRSSLARLLHAARPGVLPLKKLARRGRHRSGQLCPPLKVPFIQEKVCLANAGPANTWWYHIGASLRGVIKVYSQSVCVRSPLTCQFQAVFRSPDCNRRNSSSLQGVTTALTFPL